MKAKIFMGLLLFIVLITTLTKLIQTTLKVENHNNSITTKTVTNSQKIDRDTANRDTKINYFSKGYQNPSLNYIQKSGNKSAKKYPSRHLKGKIIYMSLTDK